MHWQDMHNLLLTAERQRAVTKWVPKMPANPPSLRGGVVVGGPLCNIALNHSREGSLDFTLPLPGPNHFKEQD